MLEHVAGYRDRLDEFESALNKYFDRDDENAFNLKDCLKKMKSYVPDEKQSWLAEPEDLLFKDLVKFVPYVGEKKSELNDELIAEIQEFAKTYFGFLWKIWNRFFKAKEDATKLPDHFYTNVLLTARMSAAFYGLDNDVQSSLDARFDHMRKSFFSSFGFCCVCEKPGKSQCGRCSLMRYLRHS